MGPQFNGFGEKGGAGHCATRPTTRAVSGRRAPVAVTLMRLRDERAERTRSPSTLGGAVVIP